MCQHSTDQLGFCHLDVLAPNTKPRRELASASGYLGVLSLLCWLRVLRLLYWRALKRTDEEISISPQTLPS